jgi:hypothetical protein
MPLIDYGKCISEGIVIILIFLKNSNFERMAAAGRLSEIMGEKTLEFDKYMRNLDLSLTKYESGMDESLR